MWQKKINDQNATVLYNKGDGVFWLHELISAMDQNKEVEKESDEADKSTDSSGQDECKHDEKAQIGPSKPVLCDDHFKDIMAFTDDHRKLVKCENIHLIFALHDEF